MYLCSLKLLLVTVLGVMASDVTVEGAWRILQGHRLERGRVVLARASDGSAAASETAETSDWFGFVNQQRRSHRHIELAGGHFLTGYSDAVTRRYRVSPRPLPPQAAGDPDCARATSRFGNSPGAPDRSGRMLGHLTVTYRFHSEFHSIIAVTFAPDLGCLLLHAAFYTAGAWGVPEHVATWEATAIRLGVPDPKWFAPVGRLVDRTGNPYCGNQ